MNRRERRPAWLTPSVRRYIRRVAYDFHVRAFGEEMARVNFLPLEERKAYIRDMIDHARDRSVRLKKPARGVTP